MTEQVKEILENLKCGDYVNVVYGLGQKLQMVAGTVKKIEDCITIEKDDGRPCVVYLELLLAIDVQEDDTAHPEEKDRIPNDNALQPAAPEPAEETENEREFVELPPAQKYTFSVEEALKSMGAQMRKEESLTIANGLTAVISSLRDAIKNKAIVYKYHDLKRKTLDLQNQCKTESDYRYSNLMLGVLAICAKDYAQAPEPLVRAGKYAMAAYAASCDGNIEQQEVLGMCSLMAKEADTVIDQYVVDTCAKRKDIWPLVYLMEQNAGDNLSEEQIASCLLHIFQKSGFPAVSIPSCHDAGTAAQILLKSFPESWREKTVLMNIWNTYSSCQKPVKQQTDAEERKEVHKGTIVYYDTKKLYGFISGVPNYYFHIKQVDNRGERGILLRRLLADEEWADLEVSFRKSVSPSPNGDFAATDICLTDPGYERAQQVTYSVKACQWTGFIAEYDRLQERGIIQSGEDRYTFFLTSVKDPYLKAYYRENIFPKEQDVLFDLKASPDRKKKNVTDIRWKNPSPSDFEDSGGYVDEEEKKEWEKFLRMKEEKKELPRDVDPYGNLPFISLPDWQPPKTAEDGPFAHSGDALKDTLQDMEKAQPISAFPAGKREWEVALQQGRKAVLKGALDEAEQKILYALENGGNVDTLIGDIITLYLRQPDKLQKAVALLDQYEGCIPIEKELNLKIQVHDKLKNYTILCKLYEQAIQHAKNISQKAHYLFRLVGVYMELGKYEEALETCRRWDNLYHQNRFTMEGVKLQKVVGNIERKKAVCFYHTGRMEEAERIATDLVRINPSDAVANAILSGTLVDRFTSEDYVVYDEDTLRDNLPGDMQSQLSSFVHSMIQSSDIGVVLKSKDIKEGKYTGDINRAKEDVEFLLGKRGLTLKGRSENLFAACKIIEQVEQREGAAVWSANYCCRLAGRAMASWGDYMVTQSGRQLDTTRMAYLFSLRVLRSNKNGMEQDWINSYNRYLKSYFLGKNELEAYISQQTNSREKDGINADVFADRYLPDVLVGEFVVGILEMLRILEDHGEWRHVLIGDLYHKSEELRHAVWKQLNALLNRKGKNTESFEEFRDKLMEAISYTERRRNLMHDTLEQIQRTFLEEMLLQEQLDKLEPGNWQGLLNALDMSRVGRVYQVIRRTQDYFVNVDFESRGDCLRVSLTELKDIIQDIQAEPTDLCYDELLPFLESLNGKLVETQNRLYREFRPQLTWRESVAPFYTQDRMVQIQLLVKNAANYQAAELLHIHDVTGSDITYFRECDASCNLRGGEEREFIVVLQIGEEAQRVGSFSMELHYAYKYSDTSQSVASEEKSWESTFVIRDEDFAPLKNPFKEHIGNKMTDASMFYGRSGMIGQIMEMICLPNSERMNYGRAVSLYGQTRTGKSSLMYHLKEGLKEKYGERILIWDMANIGEIKVGEDANDYLVNFLYTMLDIGAEAIDENSRICAAVEEKGLEPPLDLIMEKPFSAMNYFTSYMRKLNHVLQENNCIIVLFIDEFTYLHGQIKSGKLSEDFMKFWKAFLQNYCVFAIVAGQDDMPEFMREYQNEFACMELRKITYLDEVSAKRLIQEPLERANNKDHIFREDGSVDMLYKLTSGSAFLAIILCSNLVEYLNDKGARMVTRGIVDDFLRSRVLGAASFLEEAHFEAQLQERGHRELDQANKEILLSIARQSQSTGHARIDRIVYPNAKQEELEGLLQRLVDRNVLIRQGRDEYKIQVELLEKWLIDTRGV